MKRTIITIPPETQRLNDLLWAFDFATQFKHDRETDLAKIAELARASRLYQLSENIAAYIKI